MPTIWPTRLRGFSEETGSWKTSWTSRRSGSSALATQMRDVAAAEAQGARGGLEQADDAAGQRALAAARFPDDPQRLALAQRQRDVIDSVHHADRAVDQHALLDREVQLDVLDLEQRLPVGPLRTSSALRTALARSR